MSNRPIGAVTFDLWDCLFHDDSDEPKRAAAGLPPKPVARRDLLHRLLSKHAHTDRVLSDLAFDVSDAAFRKVWHDQHVTWSVAERMRVLLDGFGRALPDEDFAELVDALERMELEYSPNPAPGAAEALRALHGKYKLAIVSDAIFTPGKNLRTLLDSAGMLSCFDYFVFSDEIGHSKPHPSVFEAVSGHFGVTLDSLVHIGDRPHNDLGGPHAVGARGVLLTVVKDRPLEGHVPDAVCANYADLPAILAGME
ncbi:MAG: HAD family hydrolase [Candidatus Hydrogenedentes bacterium]|nr:HAD family hydrolase [Candidatus Hydrogenedentota bacterium]